MSWWNRLFGARHTVEGGVKVLQAGDHQKAATRFAIEAAKASTGPMKYAFVFRTKPEAVAAGANYAKEAKEFLVGDPWVEVYTDGVCYLFFVLKKEISDTVLFAFARSIKDKGGIGFMASSAATQMQKQLLDLFAAKRALRIDH